MAATPKSGTPDPERPANSSATSGPGVDTALELPLTTATPHHATALAKAFGYTTVGELLGHLPRRYAHRGELTPLNRLEVGDDVTVVAEVVQAEVRPMRARRGAILQVTITDGTGRLALTFFCRSENDAQWRRSQLPPGSRGMFSGKVGQFRQERQLSHPDFVLFDNAEFTGADAEAAAKRPIPIYPATAALPTWKIRTAVETALDAVAASGLPVPDPIPELIRGRDGLDRHAAALEGIHRPETDSDAQRARRTLVVAEALELQTALVRRRDDRAAERATPRRAGEIREAFDARLAFELTADQLTVGERIDADLARDHPMNRLVQGEVGSGKTLVALRAMLAVAESGGQAALLAPTEVLAQQHLRSITSALGADLAARVRPTLLTGALSTSERKRALLAAASGSAQIVVGTHALLADRVQFADLALIVIDEQHRFGVEQRDALKSKASRAPHVLVLTATPIPRTVAMTVFGDLDVSTITTLPHGRIPITSHSVPLADKPQWESRIWQRAEEEIAAGRQVFVVCAAIDEKDASDAPDPTGDPDAELTTLPPPHTVEATLAELATHPVLGSRRIAALTGRMSSDEKESVMAAVSAGQIDLLVATTVIEVGVDVPNATLMVVRDADRFGISQLHQLRGRVGRGIHAGTCLFVTQAPAGTVARERVEATAASIDGFELAEADLRLRREGDVLGAAQSGRRSRLRLLSVIDDADVIVRARADAIEIVAADPTLAGHPALASAIARRLDADAARFLTRS